MDEVKLTHWRKSFDEEVHFFKIQFDSYFTSKKLEDFYVLNVDNITQTLSISIIDNSLPKHLQERLIMILSKTRPEDSV